ncbi:MAG: flagellar biosynthesis anti-sigma factor FlgM [Fibrobacterota bacterium]
MNNRHIWSRKGRQREVQGGNAGFQGRDLTPQKGRYAMNIRSVSASYRAHQLASAVKSRTKTDVVKSDSAKEKVEISDDSLSIGVVRKKVDQTPEIRADKVREAKKKVFYYGYPLDSDLVNAIEKLLERRIILFGD